MASIDFRTKITTTRPYASRSPSKGDHRAMQFAFESDRGRILNSTAIRRLQQKTQVFPLERNADVRSRLTHSMEVQQVGRHIVQSIFNNLSDAALAKYQLNGLERAMETVVEMSCLMHDIGNPPFGHFGEAAINQWFAQNIESLNPQAFAGSLYFKQDLLSFEGNAQAIRIIHSLLSLNLTYTQAAGIVKYTRPATMSLDERPSDKDYLMKKVGYYHSEKLYVKALMTDLNIKFGCRHPVSYIMEAADDISYCIADIEDAVEKGILSIEQLNTLLEQSYQGVLKDLSISSKKSQSVMQEIIGKTNKPGSYFIHLRVALSRVLVPFATKRFIDNIESIYHGDFNQALLEDHSHSHAICLTLKHIARQHVFCHKEVERLELQGFKILTSLFDAYRPILTLDAKTFALALAGEREAPLIEARLCKKLPQVYKSAYLAAITELTMDSEKAIATELYYRCRLIQDYISGMTDQIAYDEYRLFMVLD